MRRGRVSPRCCGRWASRRTTTSRSSSRRSVTSRSRTSTSRRRSSRSAKAAGFAEAVIGVLSTVRSGGVRLRAAAARRRLARAGRRRAHGARPRAPIRRSPRSAPSSSEWYEPDVLQEVGAAIDRFAIRRSALDAGEVDAGQRDDTSDVLFCSDACLLVRRDAIDGGRWTRREGWPFYEDVDLCWRLRARGARVVVEPQARVRHAADLSRGRRLFESIALREHAERGRLRFMLKHYAPLGLARAPAAARRRVVRSASSARVVAARAVARPRDRRCVDADRCASCRGSSASVDARRRRASKTGSCSRSPRAARSATCAANVPSGRRASSQPSVAFGERFAAMLRQPVTWVTVVADRRRHRSAPQRALRRAFALGELRALAPFGDAIADHFGTRPPRGARPLRPGRARAESSSALVRSILFARRARGEGRPRSRRCCSPRSPGARVGRSLAVRPDAASLARDRRCGESRHAVAAARRRVRRARAVGGVAVARRVSCSRRRRSARALQARVRFVARWAFGWAVTVALHPPAFVWLARARRRLIVARRRDDDDRTDRRDRVRILVTGAIGAFVLLLPWSIAVVHAAVAARRASGMARPRRSTAGSSARRSAAAGRSSRGSSSRSLAAFFVGLDRTTFALAALAGVARRSPASTGAFPRETMLAGAGRLRVPRSLRSPRGTSSRRSPRYELGTPSGGGDRRRSSRSAAMWIGGVVTTVPSGARVARRSRSIAGVRARETGRVLWLAETTGGVRAWSTLSFAERLGAFPAPGGPEERLVTRADRSRARRTHAPSRRRPRARRHLAHRRARRRVATRARRPKRTSRRRRSRGRRPCIRNDGWRGPAMLLSAPPSDPLSPPASPTSCATRGASHVRAGRTDRSRCGRTAEPNAAEVVVYVAGGHRGGLRIEGARGRVAAAGAYVPASGRRGTGRVDAARDAGGDGCCRSRRC